MLKTMLPIFTVILAGGLSPHATAAVQPNFLIIMADDCTHSDLPLYGGENALTPNIDRLATEGLAFNSAYLAEAMCQPCRAELYSGLYPMRNGCAWNHSASRPTTTSMPQHLSALGFRVGLAGKVHVRPSKSFPFEKVSGFDPSCVRNPTQPHDTAAMDDFFRRDKDQPFCLVVALVEPHVPWVMGDRSQYPPKKIKLPPNIADTDKTREDFGAYLAEITYMDDQVGDVLASLDAAGQAGNTLVMFTSEQGSQFPGNKWTNWDTGLHTALVARWPGKIAAGVRTDALVQYADVLPTFLDAAQSNVSNRAFDGSSFLSVLLGKETKHREFVYGIHNNVPEGPPYPIRTIFDGTHRYIRNLAPDELYIEKHLMGLTGGSAIHNPYWSTWMRETGTNRRTYDLVKRYMRRPAEELYRTIDDRYEMNNLVDDPKRREIKSRLSAELDRWMHSQGDPGAAQDTQRALQAAKRGEHLYFPGAVR